MFVLAIIVGIEFMMPETDLEVFCYSGYRANERPTEVVYLGNRKKVVEVLDRWYGVGYMYFKVLLDDQSMMLLKYDEWDDRWEGNIIQKTV